MKFICYDKDDGMVKGYKWHTDVNEDISIKAGLPQTAEGLPPTTTATLQSLKIVDTESGVDIILDGVAHHIYHGGYTETVMDTVELKENKTTEINENSTDIQYPSAKAVYELFDTYTENVDASIVSALNTDVEV